VGRVALPSLLKGCTRIQHLPPVSPISPIAHLVSQTAMSVLYGTLCESVPCTLVPKF